MSKPGFTSAEVAGIQGQVTAQCAHIQREGGSHSAVTGRRVSETVEGTTQSA